LVTKREQSVSESQILHHLDFSIVRNGTVLPGCLLKTMQVLPILKKCNSLIGNASWVKNTRNWLIIMLALEFFELWSDSENFNWFVCSCVSYSKTGTRNTPCNRRSWRLILHPLWEYHVKIICKIISFYVKRHNITWHDCWLVE
jgi:hypothetical protein